MKAPNVSYTFRLSSDVHMFHCEHDDTMNFCTDDHSRLEVAGIQSDTMFTCVRNARCCGDNILKEVQGKSYQLKAARDMIEALEGFIDAHKKEEDAE